MEKCDCKLIALKKLLTLFSSTSNFFTDHKNCIGYFYIDRKCPKNILMPFLWSVDYWLHYEKFNQILLTWWKIYSRGAGVNIWRVIHLTWMLDDGGTYRLISQEGAYQQIGFYMVFTCVSTSSKFFITSTEFDKNISDCTVGGIAHICLTVVSNHCGYTPRGVRGVKRPEILWEIQKYSLPGRPSSQNWVKSKTIKKYIKFP